MKHPFSIIKNAFVRITIGIILMVASWVLFIKNLRLSIQFTWGMEVKFVAPSVNEQIIRQDLTKKLGDAGFTDVQITFQKNTSYTSLLIKTKVEDDAKVAPLAKEIQDYLVTTKVVSWDKEILESSIIGPSVGSYIQSSALQALIRGIVALSIYMIFAFRSIRTVISPGILAAITVFTMLFDIAFPAGAYGLLMYFNPTIQVDTTFIIAILTTMGYSINDTIIIFDRVRENILINEKNIIGGKVTYKSIFENSLRQTMRRSLITSCGVLISLAAMYFFGESLMRLFSFTMFAGVISGSYSSIFLSAPLAYIMLGKYQKEKHKE